MENKRNDSITRSPENKQDTEFDKAIQESLNDLREGRFVVESLVEHIERIKKLT